MLPAAGSWGGLIIMGTASVYGGTDEVEGITGYYYGGTDDDDNSGTLSYVRVWNGGAVIGSDNEINGITFAGVGSGTTVEYCEVAFNLDDGFEWFGGTVNAKYLSVLFAGDDALDTDLGFQGKIQFAYVMVGSSGNHGTEMDSKYDGTPRSHPQLYSATFIGHMDHVVGSVSTDDTAAAILRFREGTAGEFGKIVVYNSGTAGVKNNDCTGARSQRLRTARRRRGRAVLLVKQRDLRQRRLFDIDSSCEVSGVDELACHGDHERSWSGGHAVRCRHRHGVLRSSSQLVELDPVLGVSTRSAGTTFFVQTGFKGAFTYEVAGVLRHRRNDLFWLQGAATLATTSGWGSRTLPRTGMTASRRLQARARSFAGDISSDTYLYADDGPFLMTSQVFVQSGATLYIEEGTTIYCESRPRRPSLWQRDAAPALIVLPGGAISAVWHCDRPITFTSNDVSPGQRAACGAASSSWAMLRLRRHRRGRGHHGLLLRWHGRRRQLGHALARARLARRRRDWRGQRDQRHHLRGRRLGTSVDHIEVAYNLDDGIEFFGGSVNVKYASVLFVGDDSIDTDMGYTGKIQYAFVLIGQDGHHGTEMDSKTTGRRAASRRCTTRCSCRS